MNGRSALSKRTIRFTMSSWIATQSSSRQPRAAPAGRTVASPAQAACATQPDEILEKDESRQFARGRSRRSHGPGDGEQTERPDASRTAHACRRSAGSLGSRSRCTTTTMVVRISMPATPIGPRGSGSTRSRRSIATSDGSSCGWFSHGQSFIRTSFSRTGVEREPMRH